MKQLLLLVVWAAAFAGCKSGVPGDLIQPDEMKQVLYEIHVADGMLANIPNIDSAKRVAAAYYKGIYKKYDIDSVVFAKSIAYYNDNPVVMTKIYEGIVVRLEKEKREMDDEEAQKQAAIANKAKALAMRDSLTKLLLVDTTKKVKFKMDTLKINYSKMSTAKIRSIKLKNDTIKLKIDSARKAEVKKKEFVINPRKAFFWGVGYFNNP